MLYNQGENALQAFLGGMASGAPPLLLSDPFPAGYWPMPILPNLQPKQRENLLEKITGTAWLKLPECYQVHKASGGLECPDRKNAHDILKQACRRSWLPVEFFWNNLDQISLEKLVEIFLFQDIPSPPLPQPSAISSK
jgi:hypothetical protein